MGEFRPPFMELGIKASENPRQSKETNRCENQLIEVPLDEKEDKVRFVACGKHKTEDLDSRAWEKWWHCS